MTDGATLSAAGKQLDLSLVRGHRGQQRLRHLRPAQGDRERHPRRRLHQHGELHERHHLHRRRRGHPALPRLPDRAARRALELHRDLVPAHLRPAALAGRARRLRGPHPRAHDAARGPQGLLPGLPPRRAPDAGAVLGGVGAVDLLPGQPRPVRPAAGRDLDDPPPREAADHRGLRLQEVDRPAVPLPRQQPLARRELPADDVRRPGDRLRDRPRPGQGRRPAAHPARRPRAELLDLHRAARRLLAGQPVRVGVGRHQRPVRARCTAGPTRRCSRCSSASRVRTSRPRSS